VEERNEKIKRGTYNRYAKALRTSSVQKQFMSKRWVLSESTTNTKYTWDEIYLEANSKQEREDKMGMVRVKYNAEVYVTAHVPPADNKQELAEAALKAEIAINSIGTIPEGIHVRIHLNTE